jgi:hypothetical protein
MAPAQSLQRFNDSVDLLLGVEKNPASMPSQTFDEAHVEIETLLQQTRAQHAPIPPDPASPLYNFQTGRPIAAHPSPDLGNAQDGFNMGLEAAMQQTALVSPSLGYFEGPGLTVADPTWHTHTGTIHQNPDELRLGYEIPPQPAGYTYTQTRVQRDLATSPYPVGRPELARTSMNAQYSAGNMHRNLSGPTYEPAESHFPIGKQVTRNSWDCMWGSDGSGSSLPAGKRQPCSQRCSTLEALKMHFSSEHASFRDGGYMWRCTQCGLDWHTSRESCPQCGVLSWQTCYWAKVCMPSTPIPRPPVHVPAEDRAAGSRPPPWENQSTQTSGVHGAYNWPVRFSSGGYGNVSGDGKYLHAELMGTLNSSQQPRVDCTKTAPATCRSGKRLSELARHNGFIMKLVSLACVSATFPGLLVLAVYIFIWIDHQPSTRRSCVRYNDATSYIVDGRLS